MEAETKMKTCILANSAMICAVLSIIMMILGFHQAAYVLLVLVLLMCIASLVRISFHSDRLKGRLAALIILAIASFFLFEATIYLVPGAQNRGISRVVVCGTNLKGLGTAFWVYAHEYKGFLPTDNWCDRLIEEADVSPKSFKCPLSDAVEGESDYCLNVYAAGKRLADLPADMVLLFEAAFTPAPKQHREPIRRRPDFDRLPTVREMFRDDEKVYLDRWNQVGGPERLNMHRHESGCNVLFADGSTKFVQHSELPALRWNIKNTIFFEAPPEVPAAKESVAMPHPDILVLVFAGASLIVAVCILVKYKVLCCWEFALFLCVLSAATGWLLGLASEEAYTSSDGNGGWMGLFFGALTGLCFAAWLAGKLGRIHQVRSFVWFATSVGMATGVLCSTLVHLALMIVNQTANPFGIVIGIPFGAFAGAILGLIGGMVAKRCYRTRPTDEA